MSKGSIGFVGLGNIGLPMATRLVRAGFGVTACDLRKEQTAKLVAEGATAAESPADVASAAEIVFLSLPTPEVVRDVVLASNGGLLAGTRRRVVVDLSTTGPRMAQYVAAELAKRGCVLIDAPVSGGVHGAKAGTVAVMVSGPQEECERLRPAFDAIGKYFYIGEKAGHGQMMKLINNLLSATSTAAACEAVTLGHKFGLDPHTMIDVINASSGRTDATVNKFPRSILPRTFDYGFSIGLITKDVNLCLQEAEAQQVPMWIGEAVGQMWRYGLAQGKFEDDFTGLMLHVERLSKSRGWEPNA